jgi:sulfite exporter TauE/SafE
VVATAATAISAQVVLFAGGRKPESNGVQAVAMPTQEGDGNYKGVSLECHLYLNHHPSGLVVGPCTAPALGAALAYVGAQGNVLFGTTVLFVFALGMGALMIVLGTFSGALTALPRSGAWMVKIKKCFGVVMILIAEYLLIEAGRRFI